MSEKETIVKTLKQVSIAGKTYTEYIDDLADHLLTNKIALTSEIVQIPAADVVEVVRCKDCAHHDDCICVVCEEGETVFCKKMHRHVPKEFYCSYGERREECLNEQR